MARGGVGSLEEGSLTGLQWASPGRRASDPGWVREIGGGLFDLQWARKPEHAGFLGSGSWSEDETLS